MNTLGNYAPIVKVETQERLIRPLITFWRRKMARTVCSISCDKSNYIVVNGTYYKKETGLRMATTLENIRTNGYRVRFHWGNTETGEDWGDVYDVEGTIGRSTGPIKIPLLMKTKSSMGGGAILDHCIVKIVFSNKKDGGVIYQHPKYHIK